MNSTVWQRGWESRRPSRSRGNVALSTRATRCPACTDWFQPLARAHIQDAPDTLDHYGSAHRGRVPDQTAAKVIQSGSVIQKQTRVGLGIRRDSQCPRRPRNRPGRPGYLFWACLRKRRDWRVPAFRNSTKQHGPGFSPTRGRISGDFRGRTSTSLRLPRSIPAKMQGLLESQGDKLGDFIYYADADYALATSPKLQAIPRRCRKHGDRGRRVFSVIEAAPRLRSSIQAAKGSKIGFRPVFLLPLSGTRVPYRCAANSEASIPRMATIAC